MSQRSVIVIFLVSLFCSPSFSAPGKWKEYGLLTAGSVSATLTAFNFVEFIRIATGPGSEFTSFQCENTNSCDEQKAFGLQIGAFAAQGLTTLFVFLSSWGKIYDFRAHEHHKAYFVLITLLSAIPPILNGFTALPLKQDRATSDENAIVRSYQICAYVQAAVASTIPLWLSFTFATSLRH